jgi:quercetin dioxygenase-like cupin family protein
VSLEQLDGLQTLHLDEEAVPFVAMQEGLEYRLLHVRPDDGLIVTQLRAQPGAASRLHRHLAPVFGYTTVGAWGHDHTYAYRPGTYVYEPTGVLHRFLNGPVETVAMFISHGDMEYLDPATGATDRVTPGVMATAYLEQCESAGLARPAFLS